MPTLAPDSARWRQLLRAYGPSCRRLEQQTPGGLLCALLSLCSDCRGCGLPWGGQLQSNSGTLLYHKNPQLGSCRWFSLAVSFVQHKKGQAKPENMSCPFWHLDWFYQLIFSPAAQWSVQKSCKTLHFHPTWLLSPDPFSLFLFGFLMAMAKKLSFWVLSLVHRLAEDWTAGKT